MNATAKEFIKTVYEKASVASAKRVNQQKIREDAEKTLRDARTQLANLPDFTSLEEFAEAKSKVDTADEYLRRMENAVFNEPSEEERDEAEKFAKQGEDLINARYEEAVKKIMPHLEAILKEIKAATEDGVEINEAVRTYAGATFNPHGCIGTYAGAKINMSFSALLRACEHFTEK